MTREMILQLLESVQAGHTAPAAALHELARMPYEDAGFARIDHHRALRLGLPEVIYASGKTPAQVAEIFARMAAAGGSVLATRADATAYAAVKVRVPEAVYHEQAQHHWITGEQPGRAGRTGGRRLRRNQRFAGCGRSSDHGRIPGLRQ
jgi:NCAIR mutase (PurE)-related protein